MVMFSFLYACYLQTYSKRVALIEILPILEYEHRVRGLEKSFFTMTAGVSKESCFDVCQEQPKTISTTFTRRWLRFRNKFELIMDEPWAIAVATENPRKLIIPSVLLKSNRAINHFPVFASIARPPVNNPRRGLRENNSRIPPLTLGSHSVASAEMDCPNCSNDTVKIAALSGRFINQRKLATTWFRSPRGHPRNLFGLASVFVLIVQVHPRISPPPPPLTLWSAWTHQALTWGEKGEGKGEKRILFLIYDSRTRDRV